MRTINSFNINRSNLSMYDYSTDLSYPMHEVEEWNNTKTISNMYPGHKDIICSANVKFIFRLIHSYQQCRTTTRMIKYHAHCNTIRNTNILKLKRTIKDYIRRI